MRCYEEEVDFDLEELGTDAWLTGCALCGGTCWERDSKERERIDKELDALADECEKEAT